MKTLISLLQAERSIFPIFGEQLQGDFHLFDFSSNNPVTLQYDASNFDQFQKLVFDELTDSGCSWGIGEYLEERSSILRRYPQMARENRFYHVGLDIVVPQGFQLFTPLASTVHQFEKDEGVGNYGGYVILRHELPSGHFYSFYGHLDSQTNLQVGAELKPGQAFAKIGGGNDSGGWFTHVHLQLITPLAEQQGRLLQGYVTAEDALTVSKLFPNPYLLFRY